MELGVECGLVRVVVSCRREVFWGHGGGGKCLGMKGGSAVCFLGRWLVGGGRRVKGLGLEERDSCVASQQCRNGLALVFCSFLLA